MKNNKKIRIIGSSEEDSLANMLNEALIFLGYDVKVVDAMVSYNSGYSYKIIEKLGLNSLNFKFVATELKDAEIIIVTYRNLPYHWMHELKKFQSNPFVVHYNGDHIGTIERQELLFNKYDLYVTKSAQLFDLYNSLKCNALLLDEATSHNLLMKNNTSNLNNDKILMGSIYPYRLSLLNMVDSELKLYSSFAQGISKKDIPVQHKLMGSFIYGGDKLRIINKSRLVFNPFHFMDLADLTQKYFEVGGMNKPQVLPKTRRFIELFGREIADFFGYEGPQDIQNSINRVNDNYEVALDYAYEIYGRIENCHTYIHRMKLIMEYYESVN